MLDYVSLMERDGYAGGYIESTLKAVKSWLSHNGIEIRRKIKIKGARDTPSLSEEGCEYLKDYLEERIREGEEVTPDPSIITPKLRMNPFIRAVNIGDIIRGAIRGAGFSWRPYVLRSYFDTQLMLAESKG